MVLYRSDTRRLAALTERSRPKHRAWPIFNVLSRPSPAFPAVAKEKSASTSSVAPAAAKALFLFLSPFKTALCYTVYEYIDRPKMHEFKMGNSEGVFTAFDS